MFRFLRYLGVLLGRSLMNSCSFNSAGHIVHAAAYNAAVDTGELNRESGCVYSDFEREYREYIRQHSRYDAECRRLKQHGYYGAAALRRALH